MTEAFNKSSPKTGGSNKNTGLQFGVVTDGTIVLRPVAPKDIELIRIWRNAQMEVLRQKDIITAEMQVSYFSNRVWPEMQKMQPSQILVAIERFGDFIGYGGLVHISWLNKRAEVSFLLDPSIASSSKLYSDTFIRYLHLVRNTAFKEYNLHRLWTETYNIRSNHIAALETAGFEKEGILRDHNWIDNKPVDSIFHASINK